MNSVYHKITVAGEYFNHLPPEIHRISIELKWQTVPHAQRPISNLRIRIGIKAGQLPGPPPQIRFHFFAVQMRTFSALATRKYSGVLLSPSARSVLARKL